MVLGPVGVALGIDRPELRMPLVASQVIGLILLRYVLEVEPLASMPADEVVAIYAPDAPALPDRPAALTGRPAWPEPACRPGRPRSIIHHMMKNAVEVRGLVVVRGGREVLRRPRPHDRRRA